jgi:hypothetical protein
MLNNYIMFTCIGLISPKQLFLQFRFNSGRFTCILLAVVINHVFDLGSQQRWIPLVPLAACHMFCLHDKLIICLSTNSQKFGSEGNFLNCVDSKITNKLRPVENFCA